MSAYDRLLSQIDSFIRKFYKNQIVKGLLLFLGIFVFSFVLVISLEFIGRFNSWVRGVLFFTFLIGNAIVLYKYIFIPILRLNSFGERIDRYQASDIIGKYFPTISDRLLNTLQLNDQMDQNSADFELLNASVQQRSSSMGTIPFSDSINIGENKKYLSWVLPILLIFIAIGIFKPGVISQGTERVVNFSEEFKVPPPFRFNLIPISKEIEEGDNYSFTLELVGDDLPNKVFIDSDRGRFLLSKVSKNSYKGSITQVRKDLQFHFDANDFKSDEFSVKVLSKTAINRIEAELIYPSYLGIDNETIDNAGDLTIYEGTQVKWNISTKNTKQVDFQINNKISSFKSTGFSFSSVFSENSQGLIALYNFATPKIDSSFFQIDVIKDAFPTIIVEEIKDSLKDGLRYFSGSVSDDYGLSSLLFIYTITDDKGISRTEKINVNQVSGTESPFDFAVDFRREKLNLNDRISYYFLVFDNDGVNGAKKTKSRIFNYQLPSLTELNELREENRSETRENMIDLMKQADQFKKDLDRLRKEAMDSKESSWQKQQQINQLKEEQKSLIENLQKMQENMQQNLEEKDQLSEMDKEILEQQELINNLLEELMDDELKDLLDELEKLMQEQNKDKMDEKFDELEMSSEDMKKQLDRTMEMLKKLQVNEKIDEIENELKALADEQRKLENKTKDKKDINDVDVKKQEDINKKFEDIKKDMDDLDSLNNDLNHPLDLDKQEEKQEDIENELNDSKDKLEKNKGKKASESQQGAAEKMDEMAAELDSQQQQSNQQQQSEDIELLRSILENLLQLSFSQENNMTELSHLQENDPAYRRESRTQRNIIDDTKVVRDSLYALAERQPMIASFIDDELNKIQANHSLIVEDMDERRRKELQIHQQYVMTSFNNLALMLDESLQQMQSQMKSMKEGAGNCSKPGGKGKPKAGNKPSLGDMKQMLKEQLDAMKKGPNKGGKKPGDKDGKGEGKGKKPGQGQGQMGMGNKQISKMAAQQSMMRQRLEELRNELNKDGKGSGDKLNPLIKELKQQEKDLINKRTGSEMIERQQRILTRLLESEEALNERGLDEKRESKSGNNENNSNQIQFKEYNKNKLKQIELLRSIDPSYKKYYKDKANEYFNRVL